MKELQKWGFIAALVLDMVCQGQVASFNGANPNAARSLTITGTVFDPSGAPAPGVVLLTVPSGAIPNGQIKSDAQGRYSVNWPGPPVTGGAAPGPACSLFARDLEHNFATAHPIDETTTHLDLHLQPGLTIVARIQDLEGKPIPTATAGLTVYPVANGFALSLTRPTVNADDQGRVQIAALPQGWRYGFNITAPGYGTARPPIIGEAETQTTRLDLPPFVLKLANLKLAGQVLGPDGEPVAAARVRISGAGQPVTNTQTDATGHFTFKVCEGPVSLNASMTGSPPRAQAEAGDAAASQRIALMGLTGRAQTVGGDTNVIIRLANNATAGNSIPLPRPAGGGTATPVMPAQDRSIRITGTVFDAAGAPAPGVAIAVAPLNGPIQDIQSDASGKFAISWQPINFGAGGGVRTAEYWLVGRDLAHNLAAAVKIDEQTKEMDLHLQGALTLSGSVQDNNGAPVKTATVRLMMTTPPISSPLNRQPVAADEQGAFSFSALPQGRAYNLTVMAPGFGSAGMPVSANQTQTASLQLPPIKLKPADQRLEGQVVGPDDKPVPGATVRATGPGQPSDMTRTDASGRFAFKVCEGMVRVTATVPANTVNSQLGSATVQAQAGDLNVVVKLGARQAVPAAARMPQAPPRAVPLKEQSWTWAALRHWPQQHKVAVIVLLSLQMTATLGAAGVILWLTRHRGV